MNLPKRFVKEELTLQFLPVKWGKTEKMQDTQYLWIHFHMKISVLLSVHALVIGLDAIFLAFVI